ncbi:MAG: hypothetical protein L6Q66_14060 [Bacteroidia bacterium]|nr:hypothetical protein [Bacteroidia bacterium]
MTDKKTLTIDDYTKCTGCGGLFEHDKTVYHGDELFCEHCSEGITEEVKQEGIKHLDEFLKTHGLERMFMFFAEAKWSDLTLEELLELKGDDALDHEKYIVIKKQDYEQKLIGWIERRNYVTSSDLKALLEGIIQEVSSVKIKKEGKNEA